MAMSPIDRLEEALEAGDIVIFTKSEADKLREVAELSGEDLQILRDMIKLWRGVAGMGVLAYFVRNMLFLMATIAAVVLWAKGKFSLEALSELLK